MAFLDTLESLKIIKKHGIRVAEYAIAPTLNHAKKAAKKIGYPVALKIISKKIIHKTEKKAVITGIKNEDELKQALDHLKTLPGFEGVLVQEMLSGTEIIIGGKTDEQFGPTILFGLGGIFVEVFKDYSIRICPITKKDARQMIEDIKARPLLEGTRGQKAVDKKELIDTLMKVSKLLMHEKISELDINPLIITKKGIIAVDARIIL